MKRLKHIFLKKVSDKMYSAKHIHGQVQGLERKIISIQNKDYFPPPNPDEYKLDLKNIDAQIANLTKKTELKPIIWQKFDGLGKDFYSARAELDHSKSKMDKIEKLTEGNCSLCNQPVHLMFF